MSTGTVRLAFPATPVHVRTARVVSVTVARRAGLSEDVVESVRQAVGEACTLALGASRPDGVVHLTLVDGDDALVVEVAPVVGPLGGAQESMSGAVLRGLTDAVDLRDEADGPTLQLRWDHTDAG